MRELLEGISLAAFAAGNRRIIKGFKARITPPEPPAPEPCEHSSHKNDHAEHCPSHPAPKQEAQAEAADHPFVAWAKRIGGTLLVLVLLWPIVGKWVPTALGGGAALWVIAALIAGQPDAKAVIAAATDSNDDPTEAGPTTDPADLRQAIVDRLLGWMEERPGIHLSEVYERYRALPGHEHLTDDQIRTALVTHYGIPWRRAVADPRKTEKRTRAGIHRDDLQPLPSPHAETPVAATATPAVTSTVAA